MPYRKGTIPRKLKGKGIPQRFVDIWINVFNSHLKDHPGDEAGAYRRAYAVMTRNLRKAGYRQDAKGVWQRSKKSEAETWEVLQLSRERSNLVVLEEKTLDEARTSGLRLKGVALIDHAISHQGSMWERYYSPEFNDLCLEQSNDRIAHGFVCTTYVSHGAALGEFLSGTEKIPIGKVEKFYREGDRIEYEMRIAPTEEGRDVITLFYEGIMGHTSVRIYEPISVSQEVEAEEDTDGEEKQTIEEMLDGYIGGIDFCDSPGILGAGISDVLESAPTWLRDTEDDEMTFDELTLELLQAERPDLLEEYAASVLEARTDAAVVTDLQAHVAELEGNLASMTLLLKIEQAAQIGVGRKISEKLRERVSAEGDIAVELPKARSEALSEFASLSPSQTVKTKVTGHSNVGDDEDAPTDEGNDRDDSVLTEQQKRVLRFAS